ncbi:nuclear transport factor 2 family protein [Dietzia cinnamea]|uniref:nuclear transport factor 2 family protein n=1 Tax=Dietzia cinnamea TaxID=321318 RepID=UPI0009F47797|nr:MULTISPECIES: nuclear transport factor 2 family protein [Dietzia]MBM7231892.1 nuclear transport factor 2 family protein [Dietzia cinnamea]
MDRTSAPADRGKRGDHESVHDVITAHFEAYNSEDPHQLAAVLHEDAVLHSAAGTQLGLSAYLDTYRAMTSTFVDRMTPEEIQVDGDTATVTIVNTLTARADVKDFMGMSLDDGQAMTLNLKGRYTVDGDRIREINLELL